jgi:predicted nucleic-acid-binding protein
MIAADTNFLVRVLVDDPTAVAQCKLAREAVLEESSVYVPQVVQVELVWVLDKGLGLSRSELLAALLHLRDNDAFVLQLRETFVAAVALFEKGPIGFADCAILVESRAMSAELATFDRKLGRLPGARLVA